MLKYLRPHLRRSQSCNFSTLNYKGFENKEIVIEQLPFKLCNTSEIVQKRSFCMEHELRELKDAIEFNKNDIKDGFKMAYEVLIKSISERDTKLLAQLCEGNLRESFNDFYETMDEENCEVELVNGKDFNDIKIELIDFT